MDWLTPGHLPTRTAESARPCRHPGCGSAEQATLPCLASAHHSPAHSATSFSQTSLARSATCTHIMFPDHNDEQKPRSSLPAKNEHHHINYSMGGKIRNFKSNVVGITHSSRFFCSVVMLRRSLMRLGLNKLLSSCTKTWRSLLHGTSTRTCSHIEKHNFVVWTVTLIINQNLDQTLFTQWKTQFFGCVWTVISTTTKWK